MLIRLLVIAMGLAGIHWAYAMEDRRVSQGSAISATGVSVIVAGSAEIIAGSTPLMIKAVEASAKGAVVVLTNTSETATVSIIVTPEIAADLSKAVGSSVEVVTESAGYTLMLAGKMIAFVPNELSKTLIHHSQHPQ